MLANRRKERAQRKGTTCSVQCPKCQLLFLSEVSLKHHLSQERLQAICNQACELREILFTFDAQENCTENNDPEREINPECTHYSAFSQTTESSTDTANARAISRTPESAGTTNETDFQIDMDVLQNENFCASLEHLSRTWRTCLLYRTSYGLYGSLVEQVGHVLSSIPKDCQLALCKTGLNNVTLDMISNLLSGIAFHPSHPSTLFFTTHFSKGDAYLEDKHFDCFHELLYSDGYLNLSGISKPIILPPSFFTYLHSDTTDTINWLKQKFISEGLWLDGHFLFETMLIPACIGNDHWILIVINVWDNTFFPINPYHPTEPHQGDFDRCNIVIKSVSQEFTLPALHPSMPAIIDQFPIQVQETINCGIFVVVFCLAFFESNSQSISGPYNRRIPFSDGCLAAYKIKTFPFHLMTPAYVDIGF